MTAGLIVLAWVAARRADVDAAVRAERDESGGHLAAARVVHAHEQHLGLLLCDQAFGLTKRLQTFAGEAVREHGNVDSDLRLAEQVDGLGDEAGDRFARECSRELVLQRLGGLLDVLSGDGIEHLGHCCLLIRIVGMVDEPVPARNDDVEKGWIRDWLRSTRRRPATGFDQAPVLRTGSPSAIVPSLRTLRAKAAFVRERAQQVLVLGRLHQRDARLAEACPAQANFSDIKLVADQLVERDASRHQVAAAVSVLDVESPLEAEMLDHLAFDQGQLGDLTTGNGRSENLPFSPK